MYKIIDLKFQNKTNLIGAYLIESREGAILIETGPYSCHESLKAGVKDLGLKLEDIKKVLLTHIHLDHSGGAWALAEKGAQIYVHPRGAPHLIQVDKLVNSATQIYGDNMEKLWSTIKNVPQEKVSLLENGDAIEFTTLGGDKKKIIAHHTPGHAKHHIAFFLEENNTLFAGDLLGLKVENSPVLMPAPPPDIDLIAWNDSIDRMAKLNPKEIALAHFGRLEEPQDHFKNCKDTLKEVENWYETMISKGAALGEFKDELINYINSIFTLKNISTTLREKIGIVNPISMTNMGMLRYFKKHKNITFK